MGRARVTLPPGAFLQATADGEAQLARLALGHVGDAKSIADLFAGVGPFALRLAERARVIAADSDEGAIAALHPAAANTTGLKPVRPSSAICSVARFSPRSSTRIDAVVFDPPRQGAEAQARELAAEHGPGGDRGVVQSGDLRARREDPRRRAAIA